MKLSKKIIFFFLLCGSRYLYEIFLSADCYDWAFLFALILRSQTMITQVMSGVRMQDFSTLILALQRGLTDLEVWADNSWYER